MIKILLVIFILCLHFTMVPSISVKSIVKLMFKGAAASGGPVAKAASKGKAIKSMAKATDVLKAVDAAKNAAKRAKSLKEAKNVKRMSKCRL